MDVRKHGARIILLISLSATILLIGVVQPVAAGCGDEADMAWEEGGDSENPKQIDPGTTISLDAYQSDFKWFKIYVSEPGTVIYPSDWCIPESEDTRLRIYKENDDATDPSAEWEFNEFTGEFDSNLPVFQETGWYRLSISSRENDDEHLIGVDTIETSSDKFDIENTEFYPKEPTTGEEITIVNEISSDYGELPQWDQVGDFKDTVEVSIEIDGEQVETKEAEIAAGESVEVEATHTISDSNSGEADISVVAKPVWANSGSEREETIEIQGPPTAEIDCSRSSIIEGQEITCDGEESSDESGINAYNWEFGDESSYSGESTSHTFDSPGTYDIKLTVTDNNGQTSTTTTTIEVEPAVSPSAAIDCSSNSITAGESVSCSASGSTDEDTAIESYEWHFGDGAESTATGSSAEYTFDDPGSYTVELEVTDSTGLTDTTTATIEAAARIAPSAEISCSPDSVFAGEAISCSAGESSDEDGTIESYSWDFEGGGTPTGNGPSVQYRYDTPGTYTVEVTVTDNTGATGSDTTTVTVEQNQAPQANFRIATQNPTVNERITFDASASTDDNGIATYSWDLGNGDEATGSVIERSYEQPGEYTVSLETTDQAGNSDIEEKTVFVSPMFTDLSIRSIPESANDPAQLTFSTTNQLGNRPTKVQLFISTPDEVTITDYNLPPDWSTGKSATIVSNVPLQPGESEDMQMDIVATANGSYSIDGEVVYLIGNEEEKVGPISTAPVKMDVGTVSTGGSTSDSNPGFGVFVAITAISLAVAVLRRK